MTHRTTPRFAALGLAVAATLTLAAAAPAAIVGPYTPDTDTLHLYHMDETSGALQDVGNDPNGALPLDDLSGDHGASAFTGFGKSFDIDSTNNNTGFAGTGFGGVDGGGTDGGDGIGEHDQTRHQGADGQFTYEALVALENTNGVQFILSRDGSGNDDDEGNRGWGLSVDNGDLIYRPGSGSLNPSTSVSATIPTTGDDAFVANEWYHVAVSYTGDENATDNAKLYWTRLRDEATEANLLTTGTLTADSIGTENQFLAGSDGRGRFGSHHESINGSIDEVRISSTVRGADQFIFIPEPATLALLGLGGAVMLSGRKRRHA